MMGQLMLRTQLISFALIGLLGSGCTIYNNRSIPTSVEIMSDNCMNQKAILGWLNQQERQEQGLLTSDEVYENNKRAIKHHKWRIQSICNSRS